MRWAALTTRIRTDGVSTSHCSIEKTWQDASLALADAGMAADLFWQWGDKLTNGQNTHDDGNTIYYGSSDGKCLITDHVSAIEAAGA